MSRPFDRRAFLDRLRQIRREVYGEDGVPQLALALGVPPGTWENYEAGVVIPGLVVLEFLCLTGVDPRWLTTGEGDAYFVKLGERSGHA
jgi:hypothetical protein